MGKFQSMKVFDGYSTVFRQWRANNTHCQYLHGYHVSFTLWFDGELDERCWVWDFGGFRRSQEMVEGKHPTEWLKYMLDHTLIVAEDDPLLETFLHLDDINAAQVRVVPSTGAEKFAEFLYVKLNPFVLAESNGRVRIVKVMFSEHSKNAAMYIPD